MWTNKEGSARSRRPWSPRASSRACSRSSRAWPGKDMDGKKCSSEELKRGRLQRSGAAVGGRPGQHAFFELHIEQGPILEEAEHRGIGVVTAANGQKWYEITLTGRGKSRRADADEPPRKDALLGARAHCRRLVNAPSGTARHSIRKACATVGMIQGASPTRAT